MSCSFSVFKAHKKATPQHTTLPQKSEMSEGILC